MNEKFQYRTRPPRAVLKNFEFIVNERVQVNPDNSRAIDLIPKWRLSQMIWVELHENEASRAKRRCLQMLL